MAYNGIFPVGYTNYYPQYGNGYNGAINAQNGNIQNNQQGNNFQNGTSSIIWVQGEAGAKSYLVAPNTTVQLWDSENQVIYLKSADASGMPSMKVLDYTIRDAQNAQNSPLASQTNISMDYATKSDLGAIWCEIEALQKKIEKGANRNEQSIIHSNERRKSERVNAEDSDA